MQPPTKGVPEEGRAPVQSEYNEEDLIRAAQRGNRDAFARLYEVHVERVYRYLLGRLGESADAEDVTAEVFVRAMRALPSYRGKGRPFIARLFRIAHNQAVNYLKRRARRREVPLLETAAVSDDPEEAALRQVMLSEVSQAMQGLTDLQREVLTLRFGADLSITETAEAMKRSVEAAKFLQHSALRALRRLLGEQEERGHGR